MDEGERGPRLLEPVGLGSRVGPCPGVRYSEIDGSPVLWEPATRVLHELTPAGAGLWASFDGRTLAEIVDDATGSMMAGERARFEREAVEVVRRLRAVGLVEDLEDASAAPDLGPTGVPPSVLRLAGRVATGPWTEGVAVVLAPAVGADGEPASTFVEIDVTATMVVAVSDPRAGTGAEPRGVVALHTVLDDRGERPGADDRAPAPLSALALLAALMAALPPVPEPHPLVLDALASLAESVPGFAGAAGGDGSG